MTKARRTVLCLMMLLLSGCGIRLDVYDQQSCDREVYFTVGHETIWRLSGDSAFFFEAGMTITAAGAPDAFHPSDDDIALDYLLNAGAPGNWWALAVDEDGEPYIQGPGDPRPGYYVSKTSLQDETKAGSDPRRYADASVIPYVTLPYNQLGGARLGDFAVVVNRSNGQLSYAILAGFGPPRFLAVCSIALAEALGIPSSTRHGGAYGGVAYVVFPQSGNGKPRSAEEINAEGAKLFEAWGGMKRIEGCFYE